MQLDYSHLQRYLLKKVTYETTFVLPKMMTPPQGVFEPNVFTVKRKIQPSIHWIYVTSFHQVKDKTNMKQYSSQ